METTVSLPGRYWDSNTFLGWLNGEPDAFPRCDAVIEAAKAGQCRIATSTLTFAEVYWVKKGPKLLPDQRSTITALFDYSWITPIELDRATAELARSLMFDLPALKSWDAVHVASAIVARRLNVIDCFDTFDEGLVKLTGSLPDSDLILARPDLPTKLPF